MISVSNVHDKRTTVAWCNNCDIAFLKDNFRNWSSENSKIDELIKYTQLNAKESMDYLEWIDFDQFELIENIDKRGAFSTIYSAIWMEGPRWNLDEEAEIWTRTGPIKVALKHLDNSQNMSQEFINQDIIKNGNLYSFLDKSMGVLCWRDIIDMLRSISAGLNFIHENNLIHGHLHGGMY
ncbi:unnamed protein product [Rhizophagus irregularis]|nr:unnamed protein product [Rhizophagus irregularis]